MKRKGPRRLGRGLSMRSVEEKEQKGQKEAQEVSSVGIHLVMGDSAGFEISPDTHSFPSEIQPAAEPLCPATWPPLCESHQPCEAEPVRGSLSGTLSTWPHRPSETGHTALLTADSGTWSLQSLLSVSSRAFLDAGPTPTRSEISQLPHLHPTLSVPPPGLFRGRGSVLAPTGVTPTQHMLVLTAKCQAIHSSFCCQMHKRSRVTMLYLQHLTTLSPTPW